MYGYDQSAYGGPQEQQHAHGQQPYGSQPPPVAGYGPPTAYPQQAYTQQPQAAPAAPLSLADALRGYTSGAMTTEDFQDIFWSAKVYCPRGETPGFLAVQTTQEPVIPLFTSLRELRKYAGKESRYFTVSGGEVLDLLPHGYGFALDMEGEHRIVLDAKAAEEMTEYAMRRVYG
jgi:hypothetical protein